jgi:hypothetical protein
VLDPQRQKRRRQPLQQADQLGVALLLRRPAGGRLQHALDGRLVGGLEEVVELGDAAAARRLGLLHGAGRFEQVVSFAQEAPAREAGQERP